MNEVFEWVSSRGTFAYYRLVICSEMSPGFQIERFLTDGFKMLLFGTFQVLAVGTPLGSTRCGIVVGFQNLMYKRDHLRINFSESTAVVVLGKQTKKATAIARFSLAIQLLPVLLGASRDGQSPSCLLRLFMVLVVFRMNDSVSEN